MGTDEHGFLFINMNLDVNLNCFHTSLSLVCASGMLTLGKADSKGVATCKKRV